MNSADTEVNKSSHQIYRFKFNDSITQLLLEFSKIHRHDTRKDYKEAWLEFIEENREELSREVDRLKCIGYKGDCYDKMYKSARYYFRKKPISKNEPKVRRKYISTDRDLLYAMDNHINMNNSVYLKPSNGYDDFIKNNEDAIKNEIERIIESGFTDTTDIIKKIKKTYKNRYFLIIHSN